MSDKALLRAAAKRLARGDASARELRAKLEAGLRPPEEGRGGVLRALLRSPLVGADLEFERESGAGRDVDL